MAVADPPPQDLNPETGEFETPLKRVIGPGMLLVFVVGDVLGAGIYALVGVVAGETGGAIWTAFLFATILAIMTAFSYAELVTKYPARGRRRDLRRHRVQGAVASRSSSPSR